MLIDRTVSRARPLFWGSTMGNCIHYGTLDGAILILISMLSRLILNKRTLNRAILFLSQCFHSSFQLMGGLFPSMNYSALLTNKARKWSVNTDISFNNSAQINCAALNSWNYLCFFYQEFYINSSQLLDKSEVHAFFFALEPGLHLESSRFTKCSVVKIVICALLLKAYIWKVASSELS